LPPHGRREITVGDEFVGPADIGYIIFESDADTVSGYTKFYIEGQYRVAVPAVSESNTGDIYISHIASTSSWGTGVSLLNTTSSPKTLTIEFDNGQTRTVDLLAYKHDVFLIKDLFDGQAQPDIHSAVIKDASGVVGLELFSSGNQLSGILLKNDTTTNLYYPHTATERGWGTGVVAYNSSDIACDITITPYTAAGEPLSPVTDTIGGKEQYIGMVSGLGLPVDTAWLMIDASSPITGFELFANTDLLAGYTGVGITGTDGVFAKIEKDGATGIAFVNIENSSATVTLNAYNDIGAVVATKALNLNAYEKVVNIPEEIFTGTDISSATYITYSSDRQVVGFQLNASSDGMMLDALPAIGLKSILPNYNERFNGTYIMPLMGAESSGHWASLIELTSDGSGNFTDQELTGYLDDGSGTYAVLNNGSFSLDVPDGKCAGIISTNGEVFALVDANGKTDNTFLFHMGIKTSSGMSNADLHGTFIMAEIGVDPKHWTGLIQATFDGKGHFTWQQLADSNGYRDSGTGAYTVSENGRVSLDGKYIGILSGAGELYSVVDVDNQSDNTLSIHIGIKKSSGMSNADLSGTFIMAEIGVDPKHWTGLIEVTFDGNGNFKWQQLDGYLGNGTGNYGVSETGMVSFDGKYLGILSADGQVFTVVDAYDQIDNTLSIHIGIKK